MQSILHANCVGDGSSPPAFDLIHRFRPDLARLPDYTLRLSKAKEGIKRKIAKGADQREVFDAVVSVQRQLILFHERKEAMQLLMDRSLAVLAHLRKEEIQVGCCGRGWRHVLVFCLPQPQSLLPRLFSVVCHVARRVLSLLLSPTLFNRCLRLRFKRAGLRL